MEAVDGRASEGRLVVPYIHRGKEQEGGSRADRAVRKASELPIDDMLSLSTED